MADSGWSYEKVKDDGTLEQIWSNRNDYDGKITGHIVFGVKEWFDENPEERIKLGYVKHIQKSQKDIEYNKQSQYLMRSVRIIDEYTIEDEYHICEKTPEMMRRDELGITSPWDNSTDLIGGL